jgi:hypothetical protein
MINVVWHKDKGLGFTIKEFAFRVYSLGYTVHGLCLKVCDTSIFVS